MLALGIILMCFGVICTVVFFLYFMDFIGFSVVEKLFPLPVEAVDYTCNLLTAH